MFYFNILVHYFTFPPHVCVQHSGPEIKWVDGGKQLLKISTHLVSTVYTQVSYKANLIREFLEIIYVHSMYIEYMGRFLNSVCSSLFCLLGFSHGLLLLHQMWKTDLKLKLFKTWAFCLLSSIPVWIFQLDERS